MCCRCIVDAVIAATVVHRRDTLAPPALRRSLRLPEATLGGLRDQFSLLLPPQHRRRLVDASGAGTSRAHTCGTHGAATAGPDPPRLPRQCHPSKTTTPPTRPLPSLVLLRRPSLPCAVSSELHFAFTVGAVAAVPIAAAAAGAGAAAAARTPTTAAVCAGTDAFDAGLGSRRLLACSRASLTAAGTRR